MRVELALNLKGIQFERVVYGYGDSLGAQKGKYFGGRKLTGSKALPVLEIEGRSPSLMPESGSIIAYLEGLADSTTPQLLPACTQRSDLKNFLKRGSAFKTCHSALTRPLKVKMTHLKDWERKEDVAYAVEKYTGMGFDYKAAEGKAVELSAEMSGLLVELEGLMQAKHHVTANDSNTYSWDDIILLPQLRTLSVAPHVVWPDQLKAYLVTGLKAGGVTSYFPN